MIKAHLRSTLPNLLRGSCFTICTVSLLNTATTSRVSGARGLVVTPEHGAEVVVLTPVVLGPRAPWATDYAASECAMPTSRAPCGAACVPREGIPNTPPRTCTVCRAAAWRSSSLQGWTFFRMPTSTRSWSERVGPQAQGRRRGTRDPTSPLLAASPRDPASSRGPGSQSEG